MRRNHAIVIGGGIAGLLAAHVASGSFDRVTILDRDHFPERPEPRSCVPQGRHFHLLMARGLKAFEQLLPGFSDQLSKAGAGVLDFAADSALWFPSGWMPQARSDIAFHACSRDLLEWVLRRCVMASGNIQALQGQRALGLVASEDRTAILGVELAEGSLAADLVIEASGRASRTPEWLKALEYPKVAETVVEAPIDYASRWYAPPEGFSCDWKLLAISPQYPKIRCSGTIFRVEDGRWNVLLLGLDGEEAPTDDAGFLEFAQRLAVPDLYAAIRAAHPLSPIHRYRNNHNRIRHYERVATWPRNMVVVGDAVCALNPYAGLGMTSAALSVLALKEWLGEMLQGDEASTKTFQQHLVDVYRPAWQIATNQHLRWPEAPDEDSGPRPPLGTYLACLMSAAVRDAGVGQVLLSVMHMLEPSTALFTPALRQQVIAACPESMMEHGDAY